MKEILFVVGARPNFMKIAPILKVLKGDRSLRPYVVHTGQHYDFALSDQIFRDLGLRRPDENLGIGSGTHAEQTAGVLRAIEATLLKRRPAMVVVVGDVNSTLAAALAATKLHIPVAHVEAGLRSYDRAMPEEINRLATDHISDLLFTHSREADENLSTEGVSRKKIYFVGNVMIDTLDQMLPKALQIAPISEVPYGIITLHRPSNVDDPSTLRGIFRAFAQISRSLPLYFPVHPRTANRLRKFRILPKAKNFHLLEPLSYLPFLAAMARARLVLTDSGGIQEETTALGIPCLTLRKNSERMVTVTNGTNQVVGEDPVSIVSSAKRILSTGKKKTSRPPLWDGHASERIVKVIRREIRTMKSKVSNSNK